MNTLKEILLDAARYQWVRKNVYCVFPNGGGNVNFDIPAQMDSHIDVKLEEEHG